MAEVRREKSSGAMSSQPPPLPTLGSLPSPSPFTALFDVGKCKIVWVGVGILSSVSENVEVTFPEPMATLFRYRSGTLAVRRAMVPASSACASRLTFRTHLSPLSPPGSMPSLRPIFGQPSTTDALIMLSGQATTVG